MAKHALINDLGHEVIDSPDYTRFGGAGSEFKLFQLSRLAQAFVLHLGRDFCGMMNRKPFC